MKTDTPSPTPPTGDELDDIIESLFEWDDAIQGFQRSDAAEAEAKRRLKAWALKRQIVELLETLVSLGAFMRGTSTNPAADEQLELRDRIRLLEAELRQLREGENG